MVEVSIIIPIYNVEKYLHHCLDSIVNQTLSNFGVICINDGSTDNSLAILNEYAQKDNRLIVISQENQGQGIARNKGIEETHTNRNFIENIFSLKTQRKDAIKKEVVQ